MSEFRIEFDWDPAKERSNRTKHGISFEAAMAVFRDPLAVTILDNASSGEERWVTLGQAADGGLILVVHTWIETYEGAAKARIISARRPTRREARQYREI